MMFVVQVINNFITITFEGFWKMFIFNYNWNNFHTRYDEDNSKF